MYQFGSSLNPLNIILTRVSLSSSFRRRENGRLVHNSVHLGDNLVLLAMHPVQQPKCILYKLVILVFPLETAILPNFCCQYAQKPTHSYPWRCHKWLHSCLLSFGLYGSLLL